MSDLTNLTGIMDVTAKIIAGFVGGAVYAFFDKQTHPVVIAGSLGTGVAVATFLGEGAVRVLGSYFGTGGSYFIAGACGTVIIPGLIGVSKAWVAKLRPPETPGFERPENE